jgi:hypothetical protein
MRGHKRVSLSGHERQTSGQQFLFLVEQIKRRAEPNLKLKLGAFKRNLGCLHLLRGRLNRCLSRPVIAPRIGDLLGDLAVGLLD